MYNNHFSSKKKPVFFLQAFLAGVLFCLFFKWIDIHVFIRKRKKVGRFFYLF